MTENSPDEMQTELELSKAELRAYRGALSAMTPKAQIRAALEVNGVDAGTIAAVLDSWSRIQEL